VKGGKGILSDLLAGWSSLQNIPIPAATSGVWGFTREAAVKTE
jgi:hypothetical protein